MALFFNGTEISESSSLYFNGQEVSEVWFNGTLYWSKGSGGINPPPVPYFCNASDGTVSGAVELNWGFSDYLAIYEIFRDGSSIAEVRDELSYTDGGVTVGQSYTYKVRACLVDEDGNRSCSQFSPEDTGYPREELQGNPPTTSPLNLSASDSLYSEYILVSWTNDFSQTEATFTQIYRDGIPIAVVPIGAYQYFDRNVSNGVTYTYYAKYGNAYGTGPSSNSDDGKLSDTSSEVPPHEHVPSDIVPQGAGSGLDADLLDGKDSTDFALVVHEHAWDEIIGKPATFPPSDHIHSEFDLFVLRAGDTMTGPLIIDVRDNANVLSQLFFLERASDGTEVRGSILANANQRAIKLELYDNDTDIEISKFELKDNYVGVRFAETPYEIWHENNDGPNSGMDADMVDGRHADEFADATHKHSWDDITNKPTEFPPAAHTHSEFNNFVKKAGDTMTGPLNMSASIVFDNNIKFKWKDTSGNTKDVMFVDGSNVTKIGASSLPTDLRGTSLSYNGDRVITVADEGHGNNFDADTVDGKHASELMAFSSDFGWVNQTDSREYDVWYVNNSGVAIAISMYVSVGDSDCDGLIMKILVQSSNSIQIAKGNDYANQTNIGGADSMFAIIPPGMQYKVTPPTANCNPTDIKWWELIPTTAMTYEQYEEWLINKKLVEADLGSPKPSIHIAFPHLSTIGRR